jgi:AtzE family amidohydrolase
MKTAPLLQAIATGAVSARETCDATLARIEATDGRVNAFTARTAERARREADAIDARRARGEVLPPLAGLPYAVKNLFDIEGVTTLAGSKINRDLPPAREDAVLVQRLRAAGAVLVGALNMDEYAYGFTTENTHYGRPTTRTTSARSAGGSSGGSGAAVAAGQVPLALGSDTNGSIRVPASLCGVWGLKPTFGRLSRRGTYPFVHSIDHLGPLADSVEAGTVATTRCRGPTRSTRAAMHCACKPVAAGLADGSAGLRIGVLGGYFRAGQRRRRAKPSPPPRARSARRTRSPGPTPAWRAPPPSSITASEGGSLHLPGPAHAAAGLRAAVGRPLHLRRCCSRPTGT